ncbi:MAG: GHMP kinase [Armatimonadota bacterium]|jgi:D-glycero-alpha-D-manno-heptose-7-phosphate kinase|nr:GHMP kinase [Armatimonadota bacterium]
MIITQTPLRISFAGGGTDFADFYRQDGGCVVSTAIDKYIYVIVKERFDDKIRVGYSKTEMVDSVDQIEHELVRECLRKTGISRGLEIATMADIPSTGSGLGSSSTVTVGLLNALYAFKGEIKPAEALAHEACQIEIDILGKPIGKQDQYIAAYGGLRHIKFLPDDTVEVSAIELDSEKKLRLGERLILFFTGITRRADGILSEQKQNISSKRSILLKMKEQAEEIYLNLSNGCTDRIGDILNQGWMYKRQLAGRVSSKDIDLLYESALKSGAMGGKIAGAGGGGFLLFYCPPEHQSSVRERMRDSGLKEMPFNLERDGTKVIFNARR